MKLRNVIFPVSEDAAASDTDPDTKSAASQRWDIDLVDGVIQSIEPAVNESVDADADNDNIASRLVLPPLCHPHIHLDKAYLLTGQCACGRNEGNEGNEVNYADLLPKDGSFAEALHSTAAAKARFTPADLRRRGAQLLATSNRQGVTAARVFVEVDAGGAAQFPLPTGAGQTLHPSLAVALELQAAFRGRVDVQICVFAQEVLFTDAIGTANRLAIEAALAHPATVAARKVAVLGCAPYVEATDELALRNIDWAVATALAHDLHLDVHLDYNLAPVRDDDGNGLLLRALLDALARHGWPREDDEDRPRRTVAVGHATRLTRLSRADLHSLAARIRDLRLPVHFVGLPTSDLYMMGKVPDPDTDEPCARPCGTIPVPRLVRDFGLRACLGVNNVGNAFTPHGTADPLQLACWGVGLYHAGTILDAHILYGSVSWAARAAIGLADNTEPPRWLFDPAARCASTRIGPVLLVANEREIRLLPTAEGTAEANKACLLDRIPARGRFGVRDVVWDPPEVALRRIF